MPHKAIYGRDLDLERWLEHIRKLLNVETLPEWRWAEMRKNGYLSHECVAIYLKEKNGGESGI